MLYKTQKFRTGAEGRSARRSERVRSEMRRDDGRGGCRCRHQRLQQQQQHQHHCSGQQCASFGSEVRGCGGANGQELLPSRHLTAWHQVFMRT